MVGSAAITVIGLGLSGPLSAVTAITVTAIQAPDGAANPRTASIGMVSSTAISVIRLGLGLSRPLAATASPASPLVTVAVAGRPGVLTISVASISVERLGGSAHGDSGDLKYGFH